MKLSTKAIEILVTEIAGKDTLALVVLIKNKQHVSEFKIADKMKISVNQVRNMLYKLIDYNMVSFIRKKDKKKGWYIYYWTFNEARALEIFDRLLQLKIDKLNKALELEQKEQYYSCSEDKLRFNQVDAMEQEFKCPECGQILRLEDNTQMINKIKKRLEELSDREGFYVQEREKRKPRAKKIKKEIKKKIKEVKKKEKKLKKLRIKKQLKKRKKPAVVKKRRQTLKKKKR
ncbi:MAG: hypothetical protein AABX29_00065 [Nanoarchaeota archaeon]